MNRTKKKTITLLISILLHLLLFVCFLFFAFKESKKAALLQKKMKQQQKQNQRQQTQQKQQQTVLYKPEEHRAQEARPALFPKKSDGGTEVVADNAKIVPKKEKPEPDKQEIQKQIQEKIEEIKKMVEKKIAKPIEEKIVEKKREREDVKNVVKKVVEKKIVKKRPIIRSVDLKKLAIANLLKANKTKQKSLLSLTKCYLDHEKGNSSLCRAGQDRKPNFEDMKYICYEKKIEEAFVAAWRARYSGVQVQANRAVSLHYLINEHGQAEQVELARSSGNREFDKMVLKTIRHTAFPPIPKYFGVTKYRPQGGLTILR